MKSVSATLRFLTICILSFTSVSTFAQSGECASLSLAIPGARPTEDWTAAAKKCFGSDAGLSWFAELADDNTQFWYDEKSQTLMLVTDETESAFEEKTEEAAAGFMNGPGAKWMLKSEISNGLDNGSQFNYSLQLGTNHFEAACLSLPSAKGGTIVMVFSQNAPQLQSATQSIAALFNQPNAVSGSNLAHNNK